jgi:nucleotide-binding universal stress UspA family protein
VRKVEVAGESIQEALRDLLSEYPVDLVVLGTGGRRDAGSWLRPSVPDRVLHEARTMALFVPETGKGFVSVEHGGFTLRHVLIPVDCQPDPRPAVTYAFRAAVFSSEEMVRMYLLHVGSPEAAPQIDIPIRPYLAWEMLNRSGEVPEQILQAAQTTEADLLVMPTSGTHGFLGARRSGIAQQIVRSAPCPVLTVPVEG